MVDTVMTPSAQGPGVVVTAHKEHCAEELISHAGLSGHFWHVDKSVHAQGLHHRDALERHSLHSLKELSDIRREFHKEVGEVKEKVAAEACKIRELLHEQLEVRLRDDARTLRQQLVAAGIVPAV